MAAKDSSLPRSGSAWRDPWVWGVTLAGLLLRLVYVFQLSGTPFFDAPQMDALYHDQWARSLAGGDWWGSEVFFRAPLYPYFLGTIYALLGTDPLIPRLVQAFIGGATVLMTQLAARPRLGRPGSVAAGALVAVYGPLIYFEGELLLVVLEAPLFLGATWALDVAWRSQRRGPWIRAGILAGIASLVRPTMLAVMPVVLLALLLRRGRRAVGLAVACGLALLVVLTPVLARNLIVGGDLVPVASQGGLNFYLGNNPDADGMAALSPRFRSTWTGGVEDARLQAESALGRSLRPSEVSRYWTREALAWARSDPGAFLVHQFRKLGYFWDAFEIPNNQDYYFFSGLTGLFSRGWPVDFRILGPLALLGLGLGVRRRSMPFIWGAVPLVLMAVIVAFFVCGRFRTGLVPLLALWGALGITETVGVLRRRRWGSVMGTLLLLGGALWLVDGDLHRFRSRYSPAESHLRLGVHYVAAGKLEAAEAEYRRAVTGSPGFADGWNNLGTLLAAQGRLEEAEAAFERAVAVDPRHAKALGNLAALAFQRGNRESAVNYARRALDAGASEPDALYNAAVVLGNAGRVEEALRGFRAILSREPEHPGASLGAARALVYLHRPREARALLERLPESRLTDEGRTLLREIHATLEAESKEKP